MNKYLIRAGFDPGCLYSAEDNISQNLIGGNSGNMMFSYGVMNVLTTESSVCIPDKYKISWSQKEIEYINNEYSAFLLPLADAFRPRFIGDLKKYTDFIKKLKIPCIVIGVGLRAPFEPQINSKREFDEDVKAFVKAVLDHSCCLGLRGEITAKYLKNLGFVPEKDFTVIGCPSLYMYGDSIPEKQHVDKIINLAANASWVASHGANLFIKNSILCAENGYLVQQLQDEFMNIYYGKRLEKGKEAFDDDMLKYLGKENRIKFFLNVSEWLKFMKEIDLFTGNRFHGAVASILEGVPGIFIPYNSRTREMAEYHNLTWIKEADAEKLRSVFDLLDKADFGCFRKHHAENLDHYIDFLKKNSLTSVFDGGKTSNPEGSSPMEKSFCWERSAPINCWYALNKKQQIHRKISFIIKSAERVKRKVLF